MTTDTPQRQPYRAGQTVVVLCGRAGLGLEAAWVRRRRVWPVR